MATAPHLGPDPFDREVEAMLADAEFVSELDEMAEQLKRGELVLHSNDEARAVIDRRERELRESGEPE